MHSVVLRNSHLVSVACYQDVHSHFFGLVVQRFLVSPRDNLVTVNYTNFSVCELDNL